MPPEPTAPAAAPAPPKPTPPKLNPVRVPVPEEPVAERDAGLPRGPPRLLEGGGDPRGEAVHPVPAPLVRRGVPDHPGLPRVHPPHRRRRFRRRGPGDPAGEPALDLPVQGLLPLLRGVVRDHEEGGPDRDPAPEARRARLRQRATSSTSPSKPKGQRVAVVGGGPAGLMAAWELGVRGYAVTVFEQEPRVGGLMQTIPAYRMTDADVQTDRARLKDLDVTFVDDTKVGRDQRPGPASHGRLPGRVRTDRHASPPDPRRSRARTFPACIPALRVPEGDERGATAEGRPGDRRRRRRGRGDGLRPHRAPRIEGRPRHARLPSRSRGDARRPRGGARGRDRKGSGSCSSARRCGSWARRTWRASSSRRWSSARRMRAAAGPPFPSPGPRRRSPATR